jgi:hypothetical protein
MKNQAAIGEGYKIEVLDLQPPLLKSEGYKIKVVDIR